MPIGVKDIIDSHDQPTGYGSPIYKMHQPSADAATVALARGAGAILLGKTVTTEFANRHPGPTRNPHNPLHTPGGSSSGSAAAVADFQVTLATGTQTGGSVIRPAAFCGVVGYKPTFGHFPTAGMKANTEWLDTIGAYARSIEDIALFEREFVEAEQAAYMETAAEDDEIAERMDEGRRALYKAGKNEVGPYQSPMEDGMQHFHEFLHRELEPHLPG